MHRYRSLIAILFVAVGVTSAYAQTPITLDGLRSTSDYSAVISGTLGIELGVFVDCLVVGGGGGGGNAFHAGGGGGGGVLNGSSQVTNSPNNFTIGAGGSATNNGGNSTAFGITALGGGGGGGEADAGKAGSSGGGGGWSAGAGGGGTGTTGQGFAGGIGMNNINGRAGGGGGGAGASGSNALVSFGGAGGRGIASSITGATISYGGGGGGGATNGGAGGAGGGGTGAFGGGTAASGTNGLGGGGGGGNVSSGGSGGAGTVIVSYPSTSLATAVTNGTTTNYTVSGTTWTVHTFASSGSASLTLDTTNPSKLSTVNFGTFGGTGALEFLGPGTLNLVAPNTYSGGTTVRSGTLGIGSQVQSGTFIAGSIGDGPLQINPGATFQVGVIGGGTTVLPGAVAGAGQMLVNGFTTVPLGNNMASFAGEVFVRGGTVRLTSAFGLGSTAVPTRMGAVEGNPARLDLGGQAISGETLFIGSNVEGNSNALQLTNSQTSAGSWTGPIVLSCLSIGVETSAGAIVLSGPISGTGAIYKRGSGNFTITGTQPMNMLLFAEGGTLTIDGVIGSGSANLAISPGTVSGTGTINGSAQFFDGTHAPGGIDLAGIQTINGTLDYRRVTLDWSLFGNTTAGRGINYDGVDVIGTLRANQPQDTNAVSVSFNGQGSTVNWNDSFWSTDRSWTMIDVTGTSELSSTFLVPTASYVDAYGNGLLAVRPTSGFVVTNSGGDLTLNYLVAVPEPSTWVLGAVGIACAGWWAFRRRKQA